MHVWRFLLGREFNWFLYNQTKWRAAQTDLPPPYFRAGYRPSPSVHALENFKGIKEWESTDIRQSSKQSLPNLRSTVTLLLSCKHNWPRHCFCSSLTTFILWTCKSWGTLGNFHPQIFSIPLFCGLLWICHLDWAQKATTAPAFQSYPNSPSTALVSTPSSISVNASPLDFLSHPCTVITGSTTPRYATSQAHPQFIKLLLAVLRQSCKH